MDELRTDLLVFGSGGAGLFAALHAAIARPDLDITIVVKGLYGKSGCTRMVQGGFNAALSPQDSIQRHFRDTVIGGGFLNHQELAWALVSEAPGRIEELEARVGCHFDRNPDGTLHQKPFAGQTFDRTVHRGDLTGIEIVSRLADHVAALPNVRILQETRGIDLLFDPGGERVAGALVLDIQRGEFAVVASGAVLMATGGGARIYRYSSPSIEKSGDGVAMAVRAGASLVDMEMLQFHPTGLLAGSSLLTGSVVEEGLRGAGGRLFSATGERFMERYDPEHLERSTRDVVSRAMYLEIAEGRGTDQGGVLLDMSHLDAGWVRREFPGMTERAAIIGRDLGTEPIEVCPTSHFHMGGVRIDHDCATGIEGLFVAGEDSGGVHGANRLGGNGVAESTVLGARAGDRIAAWLEGRGPAAPATTDVERRIERVSGYLQRDPAGSPFALRRELGDVMWAHAGVERTADGLQKGLERLVEIGERLTRVGVGGGPAYNLRWAEALHLESALLVAETLTRSALVRTESRGAHHRGDHPERNDEDWLANVYVRRDGGGEFTTWTEPVAFTRLTPENALGSATTSGQGVART